MKAILIDVIDSRTSKEEAKKRLVELENLVNTYGGIVVVKTIQKKGKPNYDTFVGKGKLNEIIDIAKDQKADILVLNNILKPRQIFNLNEKFRKAKLETKAWDRVDTILKIFDKHAKSTEAKLQIELASIRHMGPRIFGMGIELSRQAGAMGLRAGQGESNIEMMKRHLRKQELNIVKKLEHYEKIRAGHRRRRRRNNFKTVSIVGYTNAGKSSLLNALTNKGAYAPIPMPVFRSRFWQTMFAGLLSGVLDSFIVLEQCKHLRTVEEGQDAEAVMAQENDQETEGERAKLLAIFMLAALVGGLIIWFGEVYAAGLYNNDSRTGVLSALYIVPPVLLFLSILGFHATRIDVAVVPNKAATADK